jgi:hypothetical protein
MADLLPSTAKLVAALEALPNYSAVMPDNPVLQMITRAKANWYHDFFSPHPNPSIQLMMDLQDIGASELVALHKVGEFDATFEESELWANTADGKAAMAALTAGAGKRPKP